ncbi:DegT/DnrJ/EryC1/StrS family aminotransferase [Nocardia amikacinitolerans]|uniref:DegT/DnrJ/EryC1/StrS family aminotransferase n=1 Tax=Nocardia amikacinitolerans TaxID=756689 RepID=UPI00117D6323|nr:DegT/DnrJ/EryC1/StrS family aminotransferase [Nocardia amikacinitolerans]
MSTSIDVCFTVSGLVPTQADAVSALFERVVWEERLQHEVVLARSDNSDGTVDVRVSSPEPVGFSRFYSWCEAFEERLQRQVAELVPGARVSFEREHAMTADTAPIAHRVSGRMLSLPLYPAMTDADVDDVAAGVRKITTAYQH